MYAPNIFEGNASDYIRAEEAFYCNEKPSACLGLTVEKLE